MDIVKGESDQVGIAVQPKRRIVERTYGWLIRRHRLAHDYERKVENSEAMIQICMIGVMLRHLAKSASK